MGLLDLWRLSFMETGIDHHYLIRVRELMLPRPTPIRRVSIIVNEGEWLPVIDGDTGEMVKV